MFFLILVLLIFLFVFVMFFFSVLVVPVCSFVFPVLVVLFVFPSSCSFCSSCFCSVCGLFLWAVMPCYHSWFVVPIHAIILRHPVPKKGDLKDYCMG